MDPPHPAAQKYDSPEHSPGHNRRECPLSTADRAYKAVLGTQPAVKAVVLTVVRKLNKSPQVNLLSVKTLPYRISFLKEERIKAVLTKKPGQLVVCRYKRFITQQRVESRGICHLYPAGAPQWSFLHSPCVLPVQLQQMLRHRRKFPPAHPLSCRSACLSRKHPHS